MKQLTFKTVTNHIRARKLWEEFSPHESINDEWDYRYSYFKYQVSEIHFIVAYDGSKAVGLMALQYDTLREILETFGRMVGNSGVIWMKPGYKRMAPLLLEQVQQPALISLGPQKFNTPDHESRFRFNDHQMDLTPFKDYRDYINQLWREKNAKRVLKEIDRIYTDHKVEIVENHLEDIELLFALNIARFQEQSKFTHHYQRMLHRELMNHFKTDMLTIKIDGVVQAVTFALIYKDTYIGINNGVNRTVNNLGKFTNLIKIDRAIKLGLKNYAAGRGDFGAWKETFGFAQIPHYEITLD
jgi:hypothetical protein